MQAYLLFVPTTSSSIGGGGGNSCRSNRTTLFTGPWALLDSKKYLSLAQCRLWARFTAFATLNHQQNHYVVLGVPLNASPSDIKRAYRLLAKKYHPDVSKDTRSDEVFKRIRLAYDILSNETTRSQYDRALRYQQDSGWPLSAEWDDNAEYVNGFKFSRWTNLRQRMQREKRWEQFHAREESFSFYEEADEISEDEILDEERGSFLEVLRSAFLSLFLMQTVGIRLSLMFSCLMALLDQKLDTGYKIGYLLALVLGGRGGILLTMCLSFAIWVCGKSSSSIVALVVLAMWVGSNIARYAPLPQGALLTLLYMSIKLQSDLK